MRQIDNAQIESEAVDLVRDFRRGESARRVVWMRRADLSVERRSAVRVGGGDGVG